MARRFISTGFWDDPDIVEICPQARAILLYLVTSRHTSQAGILNVHPRTIEFECGFQLTDDIADQLSKFIVWYKEKNYILVKQFVKWQCQNGSFLRAAVQTLDNVPDEVASDWRNINKNLIHPEESDHGADTVSPPCQDGAVTVRPTVTVTDTVTEKEEDPPSLSPPKRKSSAADVETLCDRLNAAWIENADTFDLECEAKGIDPETVRGAMHNWISANRAKFSKYKNLNAFIQNWLNKERPVYGNLKARASPARNRREIICPICNGSCVIGMENRTCDTCEGTGKVVN